MRRLPFFLLLTVTVAACSSGSSSKSEKSSTTEPPTTVAKTSTSAKSTTTQAAPSSSTAPAGGGCGTESEAITSALTTSTMAGIDQQAGKFTVVDCKLASSDPSWGSATLQPDPGVQLDPLWVVFHKTGGAWTVVDAGTAQVGCTGTPPAVKAEIGLDCPS